MIEDWSVPEWGTGMTAEKLNDTESGAEDTEDKIYKRYVEKTTALIERLKEIELPKPGEQLRIVTKRAFNSVAFVEYIAEREIIEEAFFVVFSFNYEAAKSIDDLLKRRRIKQATFLISSMRNMQYREKEELTKQLLIDNPHVKLIFAHSHAKIISFRTEKGNYYTVEGSGNLSSSGTIEQYVLDNDKQLFDFTMEWIGEMQIFMAKKNMKGFIVYE